MITKVSTPGVGRRTFTPPSGSSGTLTGTVTITDNAGTQTVSLSGTVAAPAVTLSATTLTFAAQNPGTSSAPQTVMVTDSGTATLNFTSIALTVGSSNFSLTPANNCGVSINASANCTINVTFTPPSGSSGTLNGILTITDNASTSPQTVTLTGTAAPPTASLSTNTLTFASQGLGSSSSPQGVTLSAPGSALSITSIAVTAGSSDFTQTSNCGTGIAASANCMINVTFTPTATGTRNGTLTITDNASTSPQTVSLTGTGTAASVSLLPNPFPSFGTVAVGSSSSPQSVTLNNVGTATLAIASIAVTAGASDFTETTTCGATLAASASCPIVVTFAPSAGGTRNGTVTITDNAGGVAGSTQTVSLTGTGAVASATLSTNTLTFASTITVGSSSTPQPVMLNNTSATAALAVASIAVTAGASDFTQTNNCTPSVAASGNCTINVTFAPSAGGVRTGTLTITDNSGGVTGSTQTVSLTGTGLGNTAQVNVNLGLTGDYTNGIFITVTVCTPGTTTCVQVPNVLVDTGSFGLRILSQVQINGSTVSLPSLPPAGDTAETGNPPFYECVQYGDLSYTWGEMEMATVQVGGETATQVPGAAANSGVPIQVIPVGVTAPQVVYYSNGTTLVAAPNQCLVYPGTSTYITPPGTANNSVAALGANGIMGIGNFAQDCGTYCAPGSSPSVSGYPYMFYDSSLNPPVYILDLIPVGEQAWNPVAAFPVDNNGEMLSLPAIPAAGQATATGTLTFGVGTESNNAIPGTATVYQLDGYGYFGSTTFNGVVYTSTSSGGSFLDSGSNFLNISDVNILNAYLNPMSLSVSDCGGNLTGWYCPGSPVTIPLTVAGTNSASSIVNLPIGNATNLFSANPTFAAFNDVAVESCYPASSCNASTDLWDLGLPFFYGKPIIIGFEGTTVGGVTSTYGYYAF